MTQEELKSRTKNFTIAVIRFVKIYHKVEMPGKLATNYTEQDHQLVQIIVQLAGVKQKQHLSIKWELLKKNLMNVVSV